MSVTLEWLDPSPLCILSCEVEEAQEHAEDVLCRLPVNTEGSGSRSQLCWACMLSLALDPKVMIGKGIWPGLEKLGVSYHTKNNRSLVRTKEPSAPAHSNAQAGWASVSVERGSHAVRF